MYDNIEKTNRCEIRRERERERERERKRESSLKHIPNYIGLV